MGNEERTGRSVFTSGESYDKVDVSSKIEGQEEN
jgi:hypothetical protein